MSAGASSARAKRIRRPWLTLATAGVATLLVAAPPEWRLEEALQFDRRAIQAGELWRLLTGHLVHWNAQHAFWDVAVLVLFGAPIEARSRSAWTWLSAAAAISVSAAVYAALPELACYRGLSGIDAAFAALWTIGALKDSLRSSQRRFAALWSAALIALLAKPALEAAHGRPLFAQDLPAGVVNVPLAHLVGALTAAPFAIPRRKARSQGPRPQLAAPAIPTTAAEFEIRPYRGAPFRGLI